MKNVNTYKKIQQQPEFTLISRKIRCPKESTKTCIKCEKFAAFSVHLLAAWWPSAAAPPAEHNASRTSTLARTEKQKSKFQSPRKRPGNLLKTARKFAANTCGRVFVYFSPLRHLIGISRRAPPAPLNSDQ